MISNKCYCGRKCPNRSCRPRSRHLIVFFEESRSRHDSPPVDAVSRPSKHLCPLSCRLVVAVHFFIQVSSTAPSAVAAFGARSTPDFDRRWTCMPADARRCPPAELAPTISRAFASDSQRQPATAGESDSGRGCNNRFKHAPDCG